MCKDRKKLSNTEQKITKCNRKAFHVEHRKRSTWNTNGAQARTAAFVFASSSSLFGLACSAVGGGARFALLPSSPVRASPSLRRRLSLASLAATFTATGVTPHGSLPTAASRQPTANASLQPPDTRRTPAYSRPTADARQLTADSRQPTADASLQPPDADFQRICQRHLLASAFANGFLWVASATLQLPPKSLSYIHFVLLAYQYIPPLGLNVTSNKSYSRHVIR